MARFKSASKMMTWDEGALIYLSWNLILEIRNSAAVIGQLKEYIFILSQLFN